MDAHISQSYLTGRYGDPRPLSLSIFLPLLLPLNASIMVISSKTSGVQESVRLSSLTEIMLQIILLVHLCAL